MERVYRVRRPIGRIIRLSSMAMDGLHQMEAVMKAWPISAVVIFHKQMVHPCRGHILRGPNRVMVTGEVVQVCVDEFLWIRE